MYKKMNFLKQNKIEIQNKIQHKKKQKKNLIKKTIKIIKKT